MMDESIAGHYLDDAITTFRAYKKLAEKALDQLQDEEYFTKLDEESNSICCDHETSGRQHAVALDGFSDYRWRET